MSVELRDLVWSKITLDRRPCDKRDASAGDEPEKPETSAPIDDH
ncbi:hypothetical protein [Actinokineospora xionganensis]|nr:hypothetical protein [Actinokineospora xionganensis]